MKKDKLQNLRDKNTADLEKELQTDNNRLWQLKADLASGKVKNVREIRQLKRQIAVVRTLLREGGENKTLC